jgi:hypothetical protein
MKSQDVGVIINNLRSKSFILGCPHSNEAQTKVIHALHQDILNTDALGLLFWDTVKGNKYFSQHTCIKVFDELITPEIKGNYKPRDVLNGTPKDYKNFYEFFKGAKVGTDVGFSLPVNSLFTDVVPPLLYGGVCKSQLIFLICSFHSPAVSRDSAIRLIDEAMGAVNIHRYKEYELPPSYIWRRTLEEYIAAELKTVCHHPRVVEDVIYGSAQNTRTTKGIINCIFKSDRCGPFVANASIVRAVTNSFERLAKEQPVAGLVIDPASSNTSKGDQPLDIKEGEQKDVIIKITERDLFGQRLLGLARQKTNASFVGGASFIRHTLSKYVGVNGEGRHNQLAKSLQPLFGDEIPTKDLEPMIYMANWNPASHSPKYQTFEHIYHLASAVASKMPHPLPAGDKHAFIYSIIDYYRVGLCDRSIPHLMRLFGDDRSYAKRWEFVKNVIDTTGKQYPIEESWPTPPTVGSLESYRQPLLMALLEPYVESMNEITYRQLREVLQEMLYVDTATMYTLAAMIHICVGEVDYLAIESHVEKTLEKFKDYVRTDQDFLGELKALTESKTVCLERSPPESPKTELPKTERLTLVKWVASLFRGPSLEENAEQRV